ncbi:hydrogenase 4 subunit B [Hyphomicrobium denitrificans 1NES1]|uniref:Hydrogenase 4 subunit B n=2 Tax=Hyphomicrobium denitrificans TaxID=53399 RepID=N0B7N6_9HYPH|nr:hydrogenase 4 subunit B [Hyphomicrobium denitrificans 1NES1]
MSRARHAITLVYVSTLIISVAACANAVDFLLTAPSPAIAGLPLGLPWVGSHFRIDTLSAFFLALVNFGAAAASFYAVGYGQHEESPGRVLPFYPAFLAGMNLVLLADDAFTFLLSWELMSLTSWALVMAHHKEGDNARAGFIYLIMASFGAASLLLAFGLLAGAGGDYLFASIRELHHADLTSGLVLVLVLIGAGSKAGLVPLHVWLPLAHPAAPSHVSALMSGVMTKVAVYGFIRIAMDLLGAPQWWWAIVVLVVGAVTAVLGVLQALMEKDIKRILACSTIENIGIIFIGLGLALAFASNGFNAAAALALTAALLHALNHSFFKSLLFFGAGAVLGATHDRNIERMGGLIHRMPQTAVFMLAGSAAISALPPFNGFVSEWLMFQAVLVSPQLPQWGLKFFVPAVGAMMALAAALAAACFVRMYGVAFLGRPRSQEAREANETDQWSVTAMGLLAIICLLAGILPGVLIDALAPVTTTLTSAHMPVQTSDPWLSIVPISESRSSYNGLLVFIFISFSAMTAAFAIHRLASKSLRRSAAWDCGYPDPSPITQYTAASFGQPIRRVFGTTVFRATEHVDMPAPGLTRPAVYEARVHDVIWEMLYAPIASAVAIASGFLNKMQFLTIRRFLSLVFVALVVLLLGLAIWP